MNNYILFIFKQIHVWLISRSSGWNPAQQTPDSLKFHFQSWNPIFLENWSWISLEKSGSINWNKEEHLEKFWFWSFNPEPNDPKCSDLGSGSDPVLDQITAQLVWWIWGTIDMEQNRGIISLINIIRLWTWAGPNNPDPRNLQDGSVCSVSRKSLYLVSYLTFLQPDAAHLLRKTPEWGSNLCWDVVL